jgi:lipopolysaccharide transport system ATP-binding protein
MLDFAISVNNIFKRYIVFDSNRSKLLHYFFLLKNNKGMREVWALKDINFQIKRGEAVAIIGRNGGGKSTLLEILAGTLTPTKGSIKVHGRVSAMLELGSGFNPQYSGRENVLLNGLLLGLCKDDILSRFDEIEAFAEIGLAIDQPVKTYSTGMIMRLAFAVQILCDPDILIIDEALSVGDFFFQQKCLSYIRDLIAKGVTLLFVSHDMGMVRNLCPRAIYLKNGKLIFDGNSHTASSLFYEEQSPLSRNGSHENKISSSLSPISVKGKAGTFFADKKILKDAIWIGSESNDREQLVAVCLFGSENQPKMIFQIGEKMIVKVLFKPRKKIINHIVIEIKNKFGNVITSTGSLQSKIFKRFDTTNIQVFELSMNLMIEAGKYSLNVFMCSETKKNQGKVIDETGSLGPFEVKWDYEKHTAPFLGMFGMPTSSKFSTVIKK